MTDYALTGAADADLEQIAYHTTERWGLQQAEAYLLALHYAFENLVAFPDAGKAVHELRQGYYRYESGSHAVFYRKQAPGVLIVRVLHQRMEPRRHLRSTTI